MEELQKAGLNRYFFGDSTSVISVQISDVILYNEGQTMVIFHN
jgi:hypothetical protein